MRRLAPLVAAAALLSASACIVVPVPLPARIGAAPQPGGVPEDFRSICQANVGSPETQIAAFRASGRYGDPVISTFDTGAQFVIFERLGLPGAGATVTTGATGANGCSVTEAGVEYTLTPGGQVYADRSSQAVLR